MKKELNPADLTAGIASDFCRMHGEAAVSLGKFANAMLLSVPGSLSPSTEIKRIDKAAEEAILGIWGSGSSVLLWAVRAAYGRSSPLKESTEPK